MKKATRAKGVVASIVALVTLATVASWAGAGSRGSKPLLYQITHNTVGDVFDPRIRLELPTTIVFTSTGDVLGAGTATGNREVYMYDVDTASITQLTNTIGGESYDGSRETDITHSGRPRYVAFVSTGDLDPGVGNADGNPEIFIRLTDTGEIRQITNSLAPVVNAQPFPSDSGQCMVFQSTDDLDNNDGSDSGHPGAGFSNPDGSAEIFMLRFDDSELLLPPVITQTSNGPAGTTSSNPSIGGFWYTRQCRSTAYQSDHDQLGNGSQGIHIYNYTKQSGGIEQFSRHGTNSLNLNPSISAASNFARGPFIVFDTDDDLLGTGSVGRQIYRHRVFRFEQKQYTYGTSGENHRPVITDGGGWIAFESNADHIEKAKFGEDPPFNADGNMEIFRARGRRRIYQVTDSESCENTRVTIRDNARAMAFISTCDLIPGNNPSGLLQVFYYEETRARDPRLSPANCQVANGCCNIENGCYRLLFGKKFRIK